jgi:hypothetical protein
MCMCVCVCVCVCVYVIGILGDIVLQIVTKSVMYLQDSVRFGSGNRGDVCLHTATSHSVVPNYILNILYFNVI